MNQKCEECGVYCREDDMIIDESGEWEKWFCDLDCMNAYAHAEAEMEREIYETNRELSRGYHFI